MNMPKALCTLIAALLSTIPATAQSEHNFEVVKNLDIFNTLYKELDLYYVDSLDAKKNVENAINYMLNQLDPFTEFYPESETGRLKQMATGRYAGIGAVIGYSKREDRCIVTEPLESMPAAKAGLRIGDIILNIDGHDIPPCGNTPLNEYTQSVSSKLRGEPGTTFELRYRRPGQMRTHTVRITRENITEPAIGATALLPDSIGYIRLAQFIEGTTTEMRRAIVDLKQQGARKLIIDLRGNLGGLIDEAVSTVNLFLPRGREVVSVKGKTKEVNHTYRTTADPLDPTIPIVVLTDFDSASASEITAGALQDYDRAVIAGSRTYGKGLVQQPRELPYKAQAKITMGRYYIPSGRCVQAYKFENGEPKHLADSLCKDFLTANGRIVRDGGGITPDVAIAPDSLPNLIGYLRASEQLTDFVVDYRNTHDRIAAPQEFHLTDKEYTAFTEFMKKEKFTYDRISLKILDQLREAAKFEGYSKDAEAEFAALEKKLSHNIDHDFERWKKEIRDEVETAITTAYYYHRGAVLQGLPTDPCVKEAARLLKSPKEMKKILIGEPEA